MTDLYTQTRRGPVLIPERMRDLPRAENGLPIPYVVAIPYKGKVEFAINDELIRQAAVRENRCGICGKNLLRGRWFIGGPSSTFHPNGAFIDGPVHQECAHYALQVCPYLAAPRYTGSVAQAKAKKFLEENPDAIAWDRTKDPRRPAYFVAVMCSQFRVTRDMLAFFPNRDSIIKLECWKHGELLKTYSSKSDIRKLYADGTPDLFYSLAQQAEQQLVEHL